MLRLLAMFTIALPSAVQAQPSTGAILASSVFAQSPPPRAAQASPARIRPRPASERPAHRVIAADLREMQAFEYRPPQDLLAPSDGFMMRGRKLAFVRTF